MSEFIHEYRETIDYGYVINRALLEIFNRRSMLGGSKHRFNVWFDRYLRAIEALYVILTPKLKPSDFWSRVSTARQKRSVVILDEILEEIIGKLERSGILIKRRVLEVGGYKGET